MSVKKTMDKTMTALDETKTKVCKVYDFVNGLSLRNKVNFDLSVKSDKSIIPVWKYGFGYIKEIRIMPVVLCVVAAFMAVCTAIRIGKHCNK